MSTDHVVVPTEECYLPGGCIVSSVRCIGCLGDGRRALLDQAVPVERCWPDSAQMWVEVES